MKIDNKVDTEDEAYFKSREKKAEKIIDELADEGVSIDKPLKVLEVGCNHGFISYHIAEKTKWDVHAGDINEENLNKYSWIKDKVKVSYLDATKMKLESESFDIVIFNHVIEHIPEWEKAIVEIHRVLKKGGILYLATPNRDRIFIDKKVKYASNHEINRKYRMDHHVGFTHGELYNLLKDKFKIKSLNKKHTISKLPRFLKPIFLPLSHFFFTKYAQSNILVAKKTK